jgi:hypothetical protein
LDARGDQRVARYLDIFGAEVFDGRSFSTFIRFVHRLDAHAVRRYQGAALELDTYGDGRYDYFVFVYRATKGWRCSVRSRRKALGRGYVRRQSYFLGCVFPRSRIYLSRKGFSWRVVTLDVQGPDTLDVHGAATFDETRRAFHRA